MEEATYKLLHTPEGVRDICNGECERKLSVQAKIEEKMGRYGYRAIQTPTFEFFDIFSKERGTASAGDMYKFFDHEGNILVLRPDMTPSIARCAAKYFREETLPVRLRYLGNTYIHNTSHQGKLNEVTQAGAELINDDTVEADAEILVLTIQSLKSAGLKEFQVEVGHAQFFNGLMEEAGFSPEEVHQMKNLMESKNLFGIEELVEKKELTAPLKELLIRLPGLFGSMEHLAYAKSKTCHPKAVRALKRLEALYEMLEAYGCADYFTIDLGMLSRYNYYTGIIMKAYTYGNGEPVAQGGRYDSLLEQFGKQAPAVGLVIVVDQLLFALERQRLAEERTAAGSLVLYGRSCRKQAILLAEKLREQEPVTMLARDDREDLEYYVRIGIENGLSSLYEMENPGQLTVHSLVTDEKAERTLQEVLRERDANSV